MTYKIGVFACNPVPYKAPLYRYLSQQPEFDVEVLYGSARGATEGDLGFGTNQRWDIPLLEGYSYSVLRDMGPSGADGFFTTANPSLFTQIDKSFDAILIHEGYFRLSTIFALVAANLQDVPVLLHGPGFDIGSSSLSTRIAKSTYIRSILSGVDAVMADCTANRQYYKEYGFPSDRIFTMRAAVDNERFQKLRKQLTDANVESVRSELRIPSDDKIVLSVGKLIERKRPFDILDAVDRLNEDINVSLVYVGDGKLCDVLKRRCEERGIDNVAFAGFQNQSELPRFYEAADVFVIPSAYDPSPKALNEAMNFGLPIVTSDGVGSAPDLIKDNGFVYERDNTDELAEKLQYLLENDDEREQMSERSAAIIDEWDYEQNADALLQACETIVNNI